MNEPRRCPKCGTVAMSLLTEREREVAALVSEGLNNTEIGAHLQISPGTVKTHVSNITGKLGYRNRTQIAVCVITGGFVMTERRGPKVISRERKLEILRLMLKGSQIVRLLPQEPCMFRGDAINLHTVWSMEREGLITREAYGKANSVLTWSISDKGKEMIREADEE